MSVMTGQTPEADEIHRVRHARAADLKHIAAIEDSGVPQFEEAFGDLAGDPLASPAPSGGERLDAPGFLLVVGPVGEPFGFAHVEVVEGFAHLAQISVRPEMTRRGYGAALLRAAMRESWQLGYDRLSLTTYRDVPWNGPFYRSLGFEEESRPEPFELRQRERETALGLDRHGPRIVMSVALGGKLPASQLASGA
jgi:GNAT superfamily N-acetyltransferase